MRAIWREACLRFLIKVLVFILCNLENKVSKIYKKFPVFFNKIKAKTLIKILRHASLERVLVTNCANFHSWELNIKRDILVQKIKVEKFV